MEYLLKKEMKVNKLRPNEWSNSTIKKTLHLKFTYGNTGYDELLRQGFPLSCRRTLSSRIGRIKFKPGILDEIFDFLK